MTDDRLGGDTNSPPITQLAQLNKHSTGVRMLGEVGKSTAQTRDDSRALQAEEGVDFFLLAYSRDGGSRRLLVARCGEECLSLGVVRLAIEGELEIARQLFVAGKHSRVIRQPSQLGYKSVVEGLGVTAVVAVSGARVEKGVATEQCRRIPVSEQADMRHGMAGRVQTLQFQRTAYTNDITPAQTPVDAANATRCSRVRQYFRAGGTH